jgi:aldehyde dehydrogenase (NAD+)
MNSTLIDDIFKSQLKLKNQYRFIARDERIKRLLMLKNWIFNNRRKLRDAMYADYLKPAFEVDLWESHVVISEINHAIRHLKKWMKPIPVRRTLLLATTRSFIQYQPRGIELIIAPWNFPFMLALGPVVSAIAAGNSIVLKPSEVTVNTSRLIKEMADELYSPEEFSVIEGDKKVAQELLKKPFDHIFFTGSIEVGKLVMKAAADNLSSITLELGGKSPVVVDESANIKDAAKKLVWSKYSNAGQTCIAPDYVLVHEKVKDVLLSSMEREIQLLFGQTSDLRHNSSELARIIDDRHFERLQALLEQAVKAGAKIFAGGNSIKAEKYIEPTILTNVSHGDSIMQEEIFGPILPVMSYTNLKEVIDCINKRTKPLALYIFSKNKRNIDHILSNTSSGGCCINDTLTQFIHPNLPFGGVNHSGLGSAHGFAGFKAFSHERAIVRNSRFSTIKLIMPPYNRFKRFIVEIVYKYL